MTIRILHTADLHLDSPLRSLAMKDARLEAKVRTASRSVLENIVRYCIDENVLALLIAGDLYDGQERSAKTAAYLVTQMERLRAAGIKVFYIKGNHDAENPIAGEIALPDNVHVFDGRGGKVKLGDEDIYIHGVSFREKHAPDSLLPKYSNVEPSAINIAMMHTSLNGSKGHDPYAPCNLVELAAAGFDYWALGHVHKRQVHHENPWIVMPGMPQGRDIGEAGPKSATLLCIADGRIEVSEVATAVVEFHEVTCALGGLDSDDAIRAAVRNTLLEQASATKAGATILRLRLIGETPYAWHVRRDADLWAEVTHGLADEIGNLWLEKLTVDLSEPQDVSPDGVNAVRDVQQLMSEISQEAAFVAEAQAELEEILALLPADRRRELIPNEAAQSTLLGTLTQNSVLSIAARMRGHRS
jgi:DNA repair protein SbcD/Mre11